MSNIKRTELGWHEAHVLNRQSANNKELLEGVEACGCYCCQVLYSPSEIEEWIEEPEGGLTAICPHCGIDAVVVGTQEQPLDKQLLSLLHGHWFEDSWLKKYEVSSAPSVDVEEQQPDGRQCHLSSELSGEDVIPLGSINLWPMLIDSGEWGDLSDNGTLFSALETIKSEAFSGMVSMEPCEPNITVNAVAFINEAGERVPYEPWNADETDLLAELFEQYGERLRGLIAEGGESMQLFALPE